MRNRADEVDAWAKSWATQRRLVLGIRLAEKLEPKDRIGKLRSTLGRIHEDREGASAIFLAGSQDWPEVYTGTSLLVHRCWLNYFP